MLRLILTALLVLWAGSAVAQQTAAQAASDMMGLGMPGALAGEVSTLLDGKADSSGNTLITSATGKSIKLSPGDDANRLLTLSSVSDAVMTVTHGDGTAGQHLDIHGTDDNSYIVIGPGSANSLENGSAIVMYGNEYPTNTGDLKLDCGNVPGAVVEVITPDGLGSGTEHYKVRWYWAHGSGNFSQHATDGGNINMVKSGTGLIVGGGNDGWGFLTTECSELTTTGGTTQTWTGALPAYAVMFALSGRVTEAYTSGGSITELDVGNGSVANQYADALALTSGTNWRSPETGAAGGTMPQSNAAAAQNIVVTANGGGTITAGKMRLCVTYLRNQAPQS